MTIIGRKLLLEIFERLDDALDRSQTICVIGAAVLSLDHVSRQTRRRRPASAINDRALGKAGRRADIAIDDQSDQPGQVYLQIIRPGIDQLPLYANGLWATGEASVKVWEGDKLTVESAPASIIAAAKLVRADDGDLDDCVFLIRSNQASRASIARAAQAIQEPEARKTASENIVLLDVLVSRPPKAST